MADYPSFGKWLRASVVASPITVICVYVLFHVILKVPLRSIIFPSLLACGANVLFGVLMFFARRYSARHNEDRRLFVLAFAAYTISLVLICIHSLVQFKLLSSHAGYVIAIISTVYFSLGGGVMVIAKKSLRGRNA